MIYKTLIRPVLFLFSPETIHNLLFWLMPYFKFFNPVFRLFLSPGKFANDITVNGLYFRNRLGVAAGLDKDGELINFWDACGFSHIELGTVTPLPQPGNPKPRLFRLVKDKAIINRMGFNNCGAEQLKENILKARKSLSKDFVVGVNIGKNKDTPLENAHEDYCKCLDVLYETGDYFTVNISSPNTEGLRRLQEEKYLKDLLFEIVMKRNEIVKTRSVPEKNIFLKIAPDLTDAEIVSIYNSVVYYGINGIIATNTTVTRENLRTKTDESGGLSGKPIKMLSGIVLKRINELKTDDENNDLLIIGAGGVFTEDDYKDKMIYGADLVQVYTGLIYEGFGLAKKILS